MADTLWLSGLAFAASLGVALSLTPWLLRFALRRNILDHPGAHKGHSAPIPYLSGLGIVAGFVLAVGTASLVAGFATRAVELPVILAIGFVLSLMGLVDDLRGLGPWTRLTVEAAAAAGLWAVGVRVALSGIPAVDLVLTVVWVVFITNAFNLLDNMDGLSAGIAAIAAAWYFVIAAANGQVLVASLAAALAGCALGFLRHNFHPAKVYMGDAGSLFLGFVLAVLGIKLRFDAPTQVTFFVPVLVCAVPLFDTLLVTVSRLRHGRNPLSGGRDHTSHRLVFIGLSVPTSVALIYGAGIASGWVALVMSRLDRVTGFLLMGLSTLLAALFGTLLGSTPVYENSQRRWRMTIEVARHERHGEPALPEAS